LQVDGYLTTPQNENFQNNIDIKTYQL